MCFTCRAIYEYTYVYIYTHEECDGIDSVFGGIIALRYIWKGPYFSELQTEVLPDETLCLGFASKPVGRGWGQRYSEADREWSWVQQGDGHMGLVTLFSPCLVNI